MRASDGTGVRVRRDAGTPLPASQLENLAADVEAVAAPLVMAWSKAQETATNRVSLSQLRALVTVEYHGRINLGVLATELGVIPSSATRLCDRLEAGGLLSRDQGPTDRREVLLSLTSEGVRLLDDLRQRRRAELGRFLAGMSPQGRQALLAGLTEFAAEVGGGEVGAGEDRQRLSGAG